MVWLVLQAGLKVGVFVEVVVARPTAFAASVAVGAEGLAAA